MRPGLYAAAAFTLLSLPTLPAEAACFREIGCTDRTAFAENELERLSCDTLWTVRNTIFHEKGYCFQTPRGRAAFSNEGCHTSNSGQLRLNRFERANVSAVQRVEKWMCTQSAATRPAPDQSETRSARPDNPRIDAKPPLPPPPAVRDDEPDLPTERGGTAAPE